VFGFAAADDALVVATLNGSFVGGRGLLGIIFVLAPTQVSLLPATVEGHSIARAKCRFFASRPWIICINGNQCAQYDPTRDTFGFENAPEAPSVSATHFL